MTTLNSKCHNQKVYSYLRTYIIKFGQIFSMPGVLHNICNMGSHDLPDMSTLALGCCAPSCWCVHIRLITPAHVR